MKKTVKTVILKKSPKSEKKWQVILKDKNGDKIKSVDFGAKGYSDFTKHKDPERKERYISRHKKNENWKKSGIDTAGFWSRWILWNKSTLKESIKNTEEKFNIKIKRQ